MNASPYAAKPAMHVFTGGDAGRWEIEQISAIAGEGLAAAARLEFGLAGGEETRCAWRLRGTTSHARYTIRSEADALSSRQQALGRPEARLAVLIPIRKSAQWWALAQDERRDIMETQSRHTAIGMDYLPQISRQLHHGRDIGEPFDFLTWFEFAPEHAPEFERLLGRLRASREWRYVEREVEVRVRRAE